tara:strand:+ start:24352 stop:24534 length:183 start_codon:yes stop_codon:yes gene_type:complete
MPAAALRSVYVEVLATDHHPEDDRIRRLTAHLKFKRSILAGESERVCIGHRPAQRATAEQ